MQQLGRGPTPHVAPSPAYAAPAPRIDRRTFAGWSVLAGLTLGIVGTTLFYGNPPGASVPVWFGAVAAVVLGSARWLRRPVNTRNLWPLALGLFFLLMSAVWTDPNLRLVNSAAGLMLCAVALHTMLRAAPLDTQPLGAYISALLQASAASLLGEPIAAGQRAYAWLTHNPTRRQGVAVAVVRGLLLAVPLLLVFGILLASADAVFANLFEGAFGWLSPGPLVERAIITLVLGWAAIGVIGYGVARGWPDGGPLPPLAQDSAAVLGDGREMAQAALPAGKAKPRGARLGLIEAGVVLGAVLLLFAAFVVVQAVYLFGGADTLARTGLTYAEYARRGYFELVSVVALVLLLLGALDGLTWRQTPAENRLFAGLGIALLVLTCVLLASAWRRMTLYTDVFGWTTLRLYVMLSLPWLALLLVGALLALLRVRRAVFTLALVLCACGLLATVNLLNVPAMVVNRNVARYIAARASDPASAVLDTCALRRLPADAVPALAAAVRALPDDDPRRIELVGTVVVLVSRDEVGAFVAPWPSMVWGARQAVRAANTLLAAELPPGTSRNISPYSDNLPTALRDRMFACTTGGEPDDTRR